MTPVIGRLNVLFRDIRAIRGLAPLFAGRVRIVVAGVLGRVTAA